MPRRISPVTHGSALEGEEAVGGGQVTSPPARFIQALMAAGPGKKRANEANASRKPEPALPIRAIDLTIGPESAGDRSRR